MDSTQVKNSVGIWAFGPNVTRFVPPGYHPEVTNEDMVTRTRRVVDGLADVVERSGISLSRRDSRGYSGFNSEGAWPDGCLLYRGWLAPRPNL